MKLNKQIIYNIITLFSIAAILLYHMHIHNNLEKIFSDMYFPYDDVRRPFFGCHKNMYEMVECIGMPSGHSESLTILSILLYYFKYISLPICILIIMITGIHRYVFSFHTILQICAGIILGVIYSLIYIKGNLSLLSFLFVFLIGFILAVAIVDKIEQTIRQPIPDWVDTSMYKTIKKKQNAPYYLKISTIYANALFQNKTFIDWETGEEYMDVLINRIKQSGTKIDVIVGIKSGGAILSDYISKELGLPNYKIKLTRKEYNCNKQPIDMINDIHQKQINNNYGEYIICEGIKDNLQGKTVLLIDELASSGTTMFEAMKYLTNEKQVDDIYPVTIALYTKKFNYDYNINTIIPRLVFVWPWGYDN